MDIQKISTDKLIPASYNPRKELKPGDPEYEKLKRSIEEFGYVEPVIWNKRTGVVIGGHQRLRVLKDLGFTEVDCVVLDIGEQQEKALNVALNKISGEWDIPLLTSLLKDLNDGGYDATITGFDVSEMSSLFDDQSEIVEDDPPEVADETQEPISKAGDRWLLGQHMFVCPRPARRSCTATNTKSNTGRANSRTTQIQNWLASTRTEASAAAASISARSSSS